jgi:hypothetical protein
MQELKKGQSLVYAPTSPMDTAPEYSVEIHDGPYRPFGIVAQLRHTCRSFGAQHLD